MTGQAEVAVARLKPDLIAGLTAAAVVLPKAMARRTVAPARMRGGLGRQLDVGLRYAEAKVALLGRDRLHLFPIAAAMPDSLRPAFEPVNNGSGRWISRLFVG